MRNSTHGFELLKLIFEAHFSVSFIFKPKHMAYIPSKLEWEEYQLVDS